MMILPFKERFVDSIMSGVKIHTIREDKSDRWKRGKTIHFATGARTKNHNTFNTNLCRGTQEIEIRYVNNDSDFPMVIIDGQIHQVYFSSGVIKKLVTNDGFDNMNDFFRWFDKDFKGKIIHWTELQY